MKRQRKQVRLHDIATKAGISVNTVSRALRDRTDVSDKTRQTVLRLAKEMGYIFPEPPAPQNKTLTIGVLINDILNPFYAKIVEGIDGSLWQHRANFLFECSYRQESREKDILSFFHQQEIDGLLVTAGANPEYFISKAQEWAIPVVFLSQRFEPYDVDYVLNDNYEGGCIATEHLVSLGHTRIAYIAGHSSQFSTHERFRGYQTVLEREGIQLDKRLLRSGDSSLESGYYLMKDLLQSEDMFTAVFAYNDLVALGATRAIKEARLKVPVDMSVVGYDDILLAEYLDVPLTSVHQPILEISRKATELLFEKIKAGSEHQPQQYLLKPGLAVRSSTSLCLK